MLFVAGFSEESTLLAAQKNRQAEKKNEKEKGGSYDYSQLTLGKEEPIDHTKYAKVEALVCTTEVTTSNRRERGGKGERKTPRKVPISSREIRIRIPLTAVVLLPYAHSLSSRWPPPLSITPNPPDPLISTAESPKHRFVAVTRQRWLVQRRCCSVVLRLVSTMRRRRFHGAWRASRLASNASTPNLALPLPPESAGHALKRVVGMRRRAMMPPQLRLPMAEAVG